MKIRNPKMYSKHTWMEAQFRDKLENKHENTAAVAATRTAAPSQVNVYIC